MKQIWIHKNINVFYSQNPTSLKGFPEKDWICFFIANEKYDDIKIWEFIKWCIDKNIGQSYSTGKFWANVENEYDHYTVMFNIERNHKDGEFFAPTYSWENTKEIFWQCVYSNFLSDEVKEWYFTIICTTFDSQDYSSELQKYLEDFENWWLPSD